VACALIICFAVGFLWYRRRWGNCGRLIVIGGRHRRRWGGQILLGFGRGLLVGTDRCRRQGINDVWPHPASQTICTDCLVRLFRLAPHCKIHFHYGRDVHCSQSGLLGCRIQAEHGSRETTSLKVPPSDVRCIPHVPEDSMESHDGLVPI
jgi:hypothetical protein